MKKLSLIILILASIACGSATTVIPPTSLPLENQVETAAAYIAITQTLDALLNAPTAANTETPLPAETPTAIATMAPVTLQGSGDNVVEVPAHSAPYIAKVTYNGEGNFAVLNVDGSGNHMDLLINTIGSYQGTVPIDFLAEEQTSRFEITASGPWQIDLQPLSMARHENIPGIIQGNSDDVIIFNSGVPDLLKADASSGSGNFAIWEYGEFRDLIINEIAPYSGTVAMGNDTSLIVVTATGPWSLEITTR